MIEIKAAPAFELVVYGTAQPAGSKRALPARGKRGAHPIVVDANRKSAPWKKAVAQEAGVVMHGRPLLEGPLVMWLTFYFARPKGHFRTGKNAAKVRESAPRYPAVRPDVLKLARGVEDALEGIAYRNDAQIVRESLVKLYGTPERVEVRIECENGRRK